ncbi:MAG: ftsB [Gammaproteobacteria bacterium]|jgi:cell division protein FtsB|nr:ftsB [Gammaproteobacteria bacterium]
MGRVVIVALVILFLGLQYKLWFEDGGVRQVARLHEEVENQKKENEALARQNDQLRAEVKDLKSGVDAPEERARNELGMIKQNEEYFQIVQENNSRRGQG